MSSTLTYEQWFEQHGRTLGESMCGVCGAEWATSCRCAYKRYVREFAAARALDEQVERDAVFAQWSEALDLEDALRGDGYEVPAHVAADAMARIRARDARSAAQSPPFAQRQ